MKKLSKKEQIEVFKNTIDIRDYLHDHGYTIDKSRNSARHAAYTSEATGDKLVVPTNGNKQFAKYYFNQYDKQDKGSILDFTMTRQNKSIDEAREYILQYQGGTIVDITKAHRNHLDTSDLEADAKRNKRVQYVVNKIASNKSSQRISELEYRFITNETIQHKAFNGKVKAHEYNGKKYAAFVMQDSTNKAQDIVLKSRDENIYLGTRNGIFISNPSNHQGKIDTVIVSFENPIEGLSHFQKEKVGSQPDNVVYLSTAGNPSERQLEIIDNKINKLEPNKIILLNDNDKSGKGYDRQLKLQLKGTNIPITVIKSKFKDWNADLTAEQMYKSRFLNKDINNPEQPYSIHQKASPALLKAFHKKDFEQMNQLSEGKSGDKYTTFSIRKKQVQFSLHEVATINNDHKTLTYLANEKSALTVNKENDIKRAKEVSDPALIQPKEKLQQLKSDVQQGIISEKALKKESSRNATIAKDNSKLGRNLQNDPVKAFRELQTKYNQEIDSIQKRIQGKPEYELLSKRLHYYRHYPHLSDKKIDHYIKMENKQENGLEKQVQKTPKLHQQEIQ